jgi:hypothetical protein
VKTRAAAAFVLASLSACGVATDPATRLAADIETGAGRLGEQDGETDSIHHATPSRPGQCEGPYKLQLDKVGAMIVWCKDAAGKTVSSHSTSSHARHVETPKTYLVDKAAGESLIIDLERRGGRAVITDVR